MDLSKLIHKFATWMHKSYYMDLSKLFHAFLARCQTNPSWIFTKIPKLVEASALKVLKSQRTGNAFGPLCLWQCFIWWFILMWFTNPQTPANMDFIWRAWLWFGDYSFIIYIHFHKSRIKMILVVASQWKLIKSNLPYFWYWHLYW